MTFVPEKNSVMFGFLNAREQKQLQACKYGWEIYSRAGVWETIKNPSWVLAECYRAKTLANLSRIERSGSGNAFTAYISIAEKFEVVEVHGTNWDDCNNRAAKIITAINWIYA